MSEMEIPATRYAVTQDGVRIAYQVAGDGPVDIVLVNSFVTHLEVFWELPSFERLIRDLGTFARVILFDKRGMGLSDRVSSSLPTLEARLDDLRAVLDAAGSEQTLAFGTGDGGALAALFAATYPERCLGLLLWSGNVRTAWAPDYPWGLTEHAMEQRLEDRLELWGNAERGEESTRMTFPWEGPALSRDPAFVSWLMKVQRTAISPGDLGIYSRIWFATDARSALPLIQAPTRLVMRTPWPDDVIEETRWTAAQIPGSSIVTLEGSGEDAWIGDVDEAVEAVRDFVSAVREEQGSSTACSRPCCSPTSSARPRSPRRWVTASGRASSSATTRPCELCSRGSAAGRSTPPATGSSPRSTDPAGRCGVLPRSSGRWRRSASRCAPDCTRARSRRSPARPVGSPS